MATAITRQRETLRITEVRDIRVTEVGPDGAGGYLRKITVWGTGEDPEVEEVEPHLTLFVHSDEAGKIKITTPEIDF